ncbi:MAG: hypothetical protein E3J23_01995, partial [Candidatus Stahlbacteria bacterium]
MEDVADVIGRIALGILMLIVCGIFIVMCCKIFSTINLISFWIIIFVFLGIPIQVLKEKANTVTWFWILRITQYTLF